MKKAALLWMCILMTICLKAQTTTDSTVKVIYCTDFEITKPLGELAKQNQLEENTKPKDITEAFDKAFRKIKPVKENSEALPKGDDTEFQNYFGTKPAKTPIANFDGMVGDYFPPDPSGAIGGSSFVQVVNSSYEVFSKAGSVVMAKTSLTTLFGNDDGDPIVMYDKFADRWVITQFTSSNSFKIYVSTTNNPAGTYYKYTYTSPDFPDYPKYSIWTDGYYMTSNQSSQVVFVFERDKMLTGNTGARGIYKAFSPTQNNSGFFCPLTATADGQLPPAGTACPIFLFEDDGDGGAADRIDIYDMTVNWGTTASATITTKSQLPVTAFNSLGTMDDIIQPGSTQKLDALSQIFMFRAQYRIWTGYNSVVLMHTIKISTSQYAIRWYELRQTGGTWAVYQQGTYNPDALNRWCGSISMDDNGSIAMAYSVCGTVNSTSVYPGLRYTARNSADPLGQMTFAETTAISGTKAQSGNNNRWGDYAQMTLDPTDGLTFWFTGQYANTNTNATRIFSFQIPDLHVGINEENSKELSFITYQYDKVLNVKVDNLPTNDLLVVDLYDITGKMISGKIVSPTANSVETSFNVSDLAAGTYLVRIGVNNTSFQKVKKTVVQ